MKLKTGLQNIKDLSADEITLIFWQSGVSSPDDFESTDFSFCFHHKILFLQYFSQKFKKCCNIFEYHLSNLLPAGRRIVTLEMAKKLCTALPTIISGHKMCSRCFTKAKSEGTKATVHNLTNDAITSKK